MLCVGCNQGCENDETPKKQKVLINGIIVTDMNIRSTPELKGDDNLLYEASVPGTIVKILEFNPTPSKEGYFWCKVKTKRTVLIGDEIYNEGWMVYKTTNYHM